MSDVAITYAVAQSVLFDVAAVSIFEHAFWVKMTRLAELGRRTGGHRAEDGILSFGRNLYDRRTPP